MHTARSSHHRFRPIQSLHPRPTLWSRSSQTGRDGLFRTEFPFHPYPPGQKVCFTVQGCRLSRLSLFEVQEGHEGTSCSLASSFLGLCSEVCSIHLSHCRDFCVSCCLFCDSLIDCTFASGEYQIQVRPDAGTEGSAHGCFESEEPCPDHTGDQERTRQ